MGRGIEKALDIQIEHPVHLLPVNPGVECVQRIVLAAPRAEPVGKAKEVSSGDGLQKTRLLVSTGRGISPVWGAQNSPLWRGW